MNELIDLQEISLHYLHNEQLNKYEQLTGQIARKQNMVKNSLKASFKILFKAIQNIKRSLATSEFAYTIDKDSKGEYWKISYPHFERLNALHFDEMQVIYAANCYSFDKGGVKIYKGDHLFNPLSEALIEKCKAWVI